MIDKTYSKTISDENKFYTSDTALELGFELKETEYNFESAEIVLLNIDDRSLVTRQVSKVEDGFTYELEDDLTAHNGEWRGQVRFEQAGEVYVSSPVKFRIENDLSNDRPPQLSDVQSWVSLKRYADSLVDELKQAVLSVDELEGTFNENETNRQSQFEASEQSRQTTFETKESEREETFSANETTRQAQEMEREGAETARQQAETQRASAESSRVSSEAQRKIDHANRSAELAGKANKKQEDWITPTLLNGAVAEYIRYRKNEFGGIDIQGNIKSQHSGWITLFNLPVGYRPRNVIRFAVPIDQHSIMLTGFVDNAGNVGVRLDNKTSNYINVSIG